MNASTEQKARIIWHCRRGMLELDLILTRFMTQYFDTLTTHEVTIFEKMLTYPDPEIYVWLIGQVTPVDEEIAEIVTFIRAHHQS